MIDGGTIVAALAFLLSTATYLGSRQREKRKDDHDDAMTARQQWRDIVDQLESDRDGWRAQFEAKRQEHHDCRNRETRWRLWAADVLRRGDVPEDLRAMAEQTLRDES